MATEIIAIASDHGGLDMKNALREQLAEHGAQVVDLGTDSPDSVDYPEFARRMAKALKDGDAHRGVLVCGTGIGISIAANRYPHVRAALAHDAFTARLGREHNDANVLVLGGRTTGIEIAKQCLEIFLTTAFQGGRHERRVAMMSDPPAV